MRTRFERGSRPGRDLTELAVGMFPGSRREHAGVFRCEHAQDPVQVLDRRKLNIDAPFALTKIDFYLSVELVRQSAGEVIQRRAVLTCARTTAHLRLHR